MKDSEIERLSMNARIKVIGGLETVRQELSKLLGKRGTLEDIYELLGWADKVFAEAKTEIAKAIRRENEND